MGESVDINGMITKDEVDSTPEDKFRDQKEVSLSMTLFTVTSIVNIV